jgi:hypothetical protein
MLRRNRKGMQIPLAQRQKPVLLPTNNYRLPVYLLVRVSGRMGGLGSHGTAFKKKIFILLYFTKAVQNIHVLLKMDKNCRQHNYTSKFITISR